MPTSQVGLVSWGSIELLHNVVRTLSLLHEQGHVLPVVSYRGKVKLHGSNCAVQVAADGIFAQSRTSLLTPEDDYKGFAAWVKKHAAYFSSLREGCIVFGEWCGPGIEKGMAISQAKGKIFAVFSIQLDGRLVYEPEQIRALLPTAGAPADLYVLPWEGAEFSVDYSSREDLDRVAAAINERVAAVEREDPFVKATFGISGLGEGLVFYPLQVSGQAADATPESLMQLMWKAKGEKHRTAGTKTAVQVEAAVVASVDEFVNLMVTEARLLQGLGAVCGGTRDPKATGKFLAWVAADVQKESAAELAASGLLWSQVDKAVQTRARNWFQNKS